jgi:hypothetical protein
MPLVTESFTTRCNERITIDVDKELMIQGIIEGTKIRLQVLLNLYEEHIKGL